MLLNFGLNSIIGSRSSGKSILLSLWAYGADRDRTRSVQSAGAPELDNQEINAKIRRRGTKDNPGPAEGWTWEEFNSEFSIEVEWSDGVKTDGLESRRYLHYIPQGYLNKIADSASEMDRLLSRSFPDVLSDDQTTERSKWKNARSEAIEVLTSLSSEAMRLAEEVNKTSVELAELGTLDQYEEIRVSLREKIADMNTSLENDPNVGVLRKELAVLDKNHEIGPVLLNVEKSSDALKRKLALIRPPELQGFLSVQTPCLQSSIEEAWEEAMSEFVGRVVPIISQYNDATQRAYDLDQAR